MNSSSSDPAVTRIRREAAAWLTRQDRGLTAGEQDEFLQWIAADPRHSAWFSMHRAGWRRLDAIADWRPEHGTEPNPDLLARPLRRRWAQAAWLAATAAALTLAAVGWWSHVAAPRPVATAGGYERRTLDDGSVAELNHGAEIEVNFSAAERRVVLRRGEVLFTVARNPQRPFIVRARGIDVRAVGTAFTVRLEAASVEVLVTEGKVQVAPPAPAAAASAAVAPAPTPAPLVVAGERALVALAAPTSPAITKTTAAQLARVRAWQPQLLDFSSTPLVDVLTELNRRNRVQITLADPTRAHVPIVASIRSDNIEGFVTLVTVAAGLRPERRGDYAIVLHAAK
jgi:transmembrane sensor